jgi:hypothetical protein
MSRLRLLLTALIVCAIVLAAGQKGRATFVQTQRTQISVYILVNVTPAPLAYVPPSQQKTAPLSLGMQLRARGSSDRVDVPNIDLRNKVADAQSAVRVQAEVSPNPNATLLYTNNSAVTFTGVAGSTLRQTCAYTITADTAITSWTVYEGLSNDFSGTAFPGKDLANNTYLQTGTPNPAPTAFIVYPDNNNQWSVMAKSGGTRTYCVDLQLTIPSTASGTYSTNAVYTMFY